MKPQSYLPPVRGAKRLPKAEETRVQKPAQGEKPAKKKPPQPKAKSGKANSKKAAK